MGTKRGRGRRSFIDSVLDAIDGLYEDVVQQLKPWAASPPKYREAVGGDLPTEEEAEAVPDDTNRSDEPALDTNPPPQQVHWEHQPH